MDIYGYTRVPCMFTKSLLVLHPLTLLCSGGLDRERLGPGALPDVGGGSGQHGPQQRDRGPAVCCGGLLGRQPAVVRSWGAHPAVVGPLSRCCGHYC